MLRLKMITCTRIHLFPSAPPSGHLRPNPACIPDTGIPPWALALFKTILSTSAVGRCICPLPGYVGHDQNIILKLSTFGQVQREQGEDWKHQPGVSTTLQTWGQDTQFECMTCFVFKGQKQTPGPHVTCTPHLPRANSRVSFFEGPPFFVALDENKKKHAAPSYFCRYLTPATPPLTPPPQNGPTNLQSQHNIHGFPNRPHPLRAEPIALASLRSARALARADRSARAPGSRRVAAWSLTMDTAMPSTGSAAPGLGSAPSARSGSGPKSPQTRRRTAPRNTQKTPTKPPGKKKYIYIYILYIYIYYVYMFWGGQRKSAVIVWLFSFGLSRQGGQQLSTWSLHDCKTVGQEPKIMGSLKKTKIDIVSRL